MDSFALLGELATKLHEQFRQMYYLLLPVFFGISLIVAWFKNPAGGPDFIESLKRTVIATLLLVGFQEMTDAILALSNGLATKISDMSGLEMVMKMASEKASHYHLSVTSLAIQFNDLLIATLSFLSYLILYVARYLMVAVYHFSWVFLLLIAPIVLLFHLFSPRVTLNLFRSLIEVASWNVVWSVLSAMLTALPFGNAYMTDGNYLTVIVLNVVIALAMLATPLIVHALIGNGLAAVTAGFGPAAVTTMLVAPSKAAAGLKFGREVLSDSHGYLKHQASRPAKPHVESTSRATHSQATPAPKPPVNK